MSSGYVDVGGLQVQRALERFLVEEALPGSATDERSFWRGFVSLVDNFAPRNAVLLAERARLQAEIDEWHQLHTFDPSTYRGFLDTIGYLAPSGPKFQITTAGVDLEMADIAGPQLVVPVMNERYALNAANARWGSLYDALYGTDALGSLPPHGPYDRQRGAEVVSWVRAFLDDVVPLERGSHAQVSSYAVAEGRLVADHPNGPVGLADPSLFAGHQLGQTGASSLFLRHHGLYIELVIDPQGPVGRDDKAGIADVVIEAALTTIMDCEDSVAAVDAADKVAVYRNWLGLMKGDLSAEVTKNGRTFTRRLAPDKEIIGARWQPGRAARPRADAGA